MTARIEWRTKGKGNDALLFVNEYSEAGDTVIKTWNANPASIQSFLNQMEGLDAPNAGLESDVNQRDPLQWGDLVISRAQPGGDVLDIDPEIYWDQIYYWFRSRGLDPHPQRRKG